MESDTDHWFEYKRSFTPWLGGEWRAINAKGRWLSFAITVCLIGGMAIMGGSGASPTFYIGLAMFVSLAPIGSLAYLKTKTADNFSK